MHNVMASRSTGRRAVGGMQVQPVVVMCVLLLLLSETCQAFLSPNHLFGTLQKSLLYDRWQLEMANIRITTPSSDIAAEMGIRDWPQQLRKGAWMEFVATEKIVVRYVLDGSGALEVTDEDQAQTQTISLAPGTLVEVTGTATLRWLAKNDMILLTPGFEEGGLLLGVIVGVIVLFGALLTGGSF